MSFSIFRVQFLPDSTVKQEVFCEDGEFRSVYQAKESPGEDQRCFGSKEEARSTLSKLGQNNDWFYYVDGQA